MADLLKYLNLVRTFECAARKGSYSKAAEELCISQSAVSQQVRRLEELLSNKLFSRVGHEMKLTTSGQQLYEQISSSLANISQALNVAKIDELKGEVTISSTHIIISSWLAPRLYKFRNSYPEISIKLISSNDFQNLEEEQIDLAIRYDAPPYSLLKSTHLAEYIDSEAIYPVCAPSYVKGYSISKPADLCQNWLVRLHPKAWEWWLKSAGIEFQADTLKYIDVTSGDMALNCILDGHAAMLLGETVISDYLPKGQLIVPFNISHPDKLNRYLIYNKNTYYKQRVKVFSDWLKSELSQSKKQFKHYKLSERK